MSFCQFSEMWYYDTSILGPMVWEFYLAVLNVSPRQKLLSSKLSRWMINGSEEHVRQTKTSKYKDSTEGGPSAGV